MSEVRVAVAGVGNCASCLVQGAEWLKQMELVDMVTSDEMEIPHNGLLTQQVGPYGPGSVSVVLGFDVDARKVGKDLSEAIWEEPNVADTFFPPSHLDAPVLGGPLSDGLGPAHRRAVPDVKGGITSREKLIEALEAYEVDVLVNFLPVGSEIDSREYAEAALKAGVAFVNAIPVFIARDPETRGRFREAGVPLLGDDIKSQVGATILHRALADAFTSRGAKIDQTLQLNVGGNTDFQNMQNEERLVTKRASKTAAVRDLVDVPKEKVHITPSGFAPFLRDEKRAFIEVEAQGFMGNKLRVELRYSGQDSPNSAAVVYDAVRYAKLAADTGKSNGIHVDAPAAWLMKAPPRPLPDERAHEICQVVANRGMVAEPMA